MRFKSLALERYGAFTGETLRFQPNARVHVVYGANEAGKTSALAAIGDFLFGFGHTTPFGFLHDMRALRIGATLQFSDGTSATLRRRKGKLGKTLLDDVDSPLADDKLLPRLAGVTRQVFDGEYGLTAEKLRLGGLDLLRAGGRLAETLAASSATLSALVGTGVALEREAGELFKPTRVASKPFYIACDRHGAAEQRLREAIVSTDTWTVANGQVAEAEADVARLEAETAELRAELYRFERARRTRPKLVALTQARDERERYADLGDVAATVLRRWKQACDEIFPLEDAIAALDGEDALDRARIDTLALDEPVLAAGDDIDCLRERIGEIRKANLDLPRRQGAARVAWATLQQAAAQLGFSSAEALMARQPPDAAMAQVQSLLTDGRCAMDRLEAAELAVATAHADHDRLAAGVEAAQPLVEPAALKRRLDAFRSIDADAEQVRREAAALAHERGRLAEATAALEPPVTCLDTLASLALPSPAEIARAVAEADALENDLRSAEEAVTAANDGVGKLARELDRLAGGAGAIATQGDLQAARQRRDGTLAHLRDVLALSLAEREGALHAVAAAVSATDATTDRIFADLERASRLERAQESLAEANERAAAARLCHDRLMALQTKAQTIWRAAWEPVGLRPGVPVRMAAWRDGVAHALEQRRVLDERRSRVQTLEQKLERARASLATLAGDAGSDAAQQLPIEILYRQTASAVEALNEAWNERRQHKMALAKAAETIERAVAVCAQRRREDARWRNAWPEAVAALGQTPDAGFAAAQAALTIWQRVPGERRAYERERQSVDGIERDLAQFAAQVEALAHRVAPEVSGIEPAQALQHLAQRLAAARTAQDQRTTLEQGAAERRGRRRQFEAKRASHAAVLDEARHQLDLATEASVPLVIARLGEKQALEAQCSALLADLRTVADGVDEDILRNDQAELELPCLDAAIGELQHRLNAASEARIAAHIRQDQACAAVGALAQGRRADAAAFEREEAAAEILAIAERWLVRAAAAKLATLAIEQHRATVQDPLVARASALFAAVTGGAFRGLSTVFDDDDALVLAGERQGGSVVGVKGMSEGTRDQLFLVLRLALLERQAHAPLPFVGDDLLASFDAERTGLALDVLAEFGAGRQVILFTHHAHVVEIARRRLGARADIIVLGETVRRSAAAA